MITQQIKPTLLSFLNDTKFQIKFFLFLNFRLYYSPTVLLKYVVIFEYSFMKLKTIFFLTHLLKQWVYNILLGKKL